MHSHILQMRYLFRFGVEPLLDPLALHRLPIVVLRRPHGDGLHHQSLAVRIKLVWHQRSPLGAKLPLLNDVRSVYKSGMMSQMVPRNPNQDRPRARVAGKLVIAGMLVAAIAAALGSLWYHAYAGAHALRYWGPDDALLIAQSDLATVCSVRSVRPGGSVRSVGAEPTIVTAEGALEVSQEVDAKRAAGLANIRRALLVDESFDWNEQPETGAHAWEYALIFRNGTQRCAVLFTGDFRTAARAGLRRAIRLRPEVAREVRAFFDQVLAGGAAGRKEAPPR